MEIIKLLEKGFIQISDLIRNENSLQLSHLTESNNNSGDDVKKIDIVSNDILKDILKNLAADPKSRRRENHLILFMLAATR